MVPFADRFSVVGIATPVAAEYPRQGKVARWHPWVAGSSVVAPGLDLLALEPEVSDLLGHLMNTINYDLIGQPLVIDHLTFIKPVAQRISNTAPVNGRPVRVRYPWAFSRSATFLNENRPVA